MPGARRRAAAAGVRAQGERPAGSARRRDERPLVGRAGDRQRRRRPHDARAVGGRRRLGPHLDLAPILKDPGAEDRPHGRRAASTSPRSASRTSTRSRAASTVDAPRLVAAGYTAEHVHAERAINGRPSRDRREGVGVRRGGDRRRQRDAPVGRASAGVRPARGRAARRSAPAAAHAERAAGGDRRQRAVPRRGIRAADRRVRLAAGPAAREIFVSRRAFRESTVAGAAIAPGSTVNATINGRQVAYQADAMRERRSAAHRPGVQRPGARGRPLRAPRSTATIAGKGAGTDPQDDDGYGARDADRSTILGGHDPAAGLRRAPRGRHGARQGDRRVRRLRSGGGQRPARGARAPSAARSTSTRRSRTSRPASRRTASRRRAGSRSNRRPSAALQITRASVDGDYRDRTGEIRTARDRRPRRQRQASGTLALNDTGQSNLTLHADSPSLEEIGKLSDAPLAASPRSTPR